MSNIKAELRLEQEGVSDQVRVEVYSEDFDISDLDVVTNDVNMTYEWLVGVDTSGWL